MKLSQHVRGLHAVIGESAADDIASDIEELESKLDAARKLAELRVDITTDQGQPGESASWRKILELLK